MSSEKDDDFSLELQNLTAEALCYDKLDAEPEPLPHSEPRAPALRLSPTRGTRLSRAVLRCLNPQQAPRRIELVSRSFMVFGRFNEHTDKGFADFSLGFISDSRKISRLQLAVCAMGEGLAAMHVSAYESCYTALNTLRLARGRWQRLESKDTLDICGLYPLKVTLGWDFTATATASYRDAVQGQPLGTQLLEVVDLLKQMEVSDAAALKQKLKDSYSSFLNQQLQTARLNGADSAGPLLYARFHREDGNRQRVTHIYLPKRLSIGSSGQAGLRVEARGVAPQHAELVFREGMYWIQNLAGESEVRIGDYGLEAEESLPLEVGDVLGIGEARLVFEGY